ncbi:MAG: hypothetical protein FJX62_10685 [Alphaproteobacteria bacterium]|nr:hypothetical protein [Alphaproteobacteria bacterium]
MLWIRIAAAIGVLSGFVADARAQGGTPLDALIEPAVGRSACFRRVYDAAHLKKVPKQSVTEIAVWLRYEPPLAGGTGVALGLGLAVLRRGETAALFSDGDCQWDAKANRDTSGRRLIKAFPREAGVVCLQSARPDVFRAVSAEEGGELLFDRGRDRDTLMLYVGDRLTMVRRANRSDQLDIRFGADDRVFLLRRAADKDCEFVKEAVKTPEPGVRQR